MESCLNLDQTFTIYEALKAISSLAKNHVGIPSYESFAIVLDFLADRSLSLHSAQDSVITFGDILFARTLSSN